MVCYLHDVASQLELRDAGTGQLRQSIPMPGLGSIAGFSGRREDSRLFFKFTGFTEPGAIYQCDLHLDSVRDNHPGLKCQYELHLS